LSGLQNLRGKNEREREKQLALNTLSGKGGLRAFKGKCNLCVKEGHCAKAYAKPPPCNGQICKQVVAKNCQLK
jgi:hypothetical protein